MKIACIVGPTACGKTWLGVELAHRLGSEIVSVDSRQVYRGLDLGTGKDLHEYRRVDPPIRHHLIDIVDPHRVFTLFDFQQACYEVLRDRARAEVFASGRVPLLMVGGSGLYLEAVLRQYRIADVPENRDLRRRLMARPREELVALLHRDHPELARQTDLSSARRVVRALEIAAAEAAGPVVFSEPLGLEVSYCVLGLHVDRARLARRIGKRVESRLAEGMVGEVSRLLRGGLSRRRCETLGMEYRVIAAHLDGAVSYDRMVEELEGEIRRLAKRQITYFHGMERRGVRISWIEPGDVETAIRVVGDPSAWQEIPPARAGFSACRQLPVR
jgi:tRNA dimethylallyltransferase